MDKIAKLKRILTNCGKVAVAFSGGVDSTFLLCFAKEVLGSENVLAVTAVAPNFAPDEIDYAEKTAERLGVSHIRVNVELPELFRKNPPDRCYHCKKAVFSELMEAIAGQAQKSSLGCGLQQGFGMGKGEEALCGSGDCCSGSGGGAHGRGDNIKEENADIACDVVNNGKKENADSASCVGNNGKAVNDECSECVGGVCIGGVCEENNVKNASAVGGFVFCDGSNFDDLKDYRPGSRAVQELGVRSPLREAELTKQEIRAELKRMDVDIWDKPAFACLASRIPYGTEIRDEMLNAVYEIEKMLKDKGYTQVRARLHDSVVRLELLPAEMQQLAADRDLCEALSARARDLGFAYTALDISGYRMGSLNSVL